MELIFTSLAKATYSINKMTTLTENGAPSLPTTGDARLDLFAKINRDTPESSLYGLLSKSWEKDPLDTLKIIFHLRDCRGGKGEREQFYRALRWLIDNNRAHLERNMHLIPFYGRFKDLLVFLSTPVEPQMLVIYTKQLKTDSALLGTPNAKQVSLAAKYAPTEGGKHDRLYSASKKFSNALGCTKQAYRKLWLGPLRKQIDENSILVERHMTDDPKDWANIDFSKISSVALKKYKKAWERHEPERYKSYLSSVIMGEKKMNVLRLMPHEIVSCYLSSRGKLDKTVETQWTSFVEQTKKARETKFEGALAVVDVSGSMSGNAELLHQPLTSPSHSVYYSQSLPKDRSMANSLPSHLRLFSKL